MQEQVNIMLVMQDEMNSKVNPDWINQGFEWYRAIWVECAELMDHHGWKWWKHQEPDDDQIKLELVDIWHFGLSQKILERGVTDKNAADIAGDLKDPAAPSDFKQGIERFAGATLANRSFNVELFAGLIEKAGMPFDELFKRYVGKNVLNFFRQDHGYKDGSYIKTWDGREDNEHLVDLMTELDSSQSTFRTDLYNGLASRYANLS